MDVFACLTADNALAQPSETSRLLYEDPYQPHYGAPNHHPNIPQPDPEELRRERDALERLCAQTSEYGIHSRCIYYRADDLTRSKLIDVAQSSNADEVSKINSEYPHLFNQRFQAPRPSSISSSTEGASIQESSWLAADADKLEDWAQVKEITTGAIVIGFDRGAAGQTKALHERTM
ncbi:MAG: hypothetical protein M1822_008771 [Bathelium mastoideum]|nr:MAG: hypothetical protein M1822_008771 [Bathelium mastoideum]